MRRILSDGREVVTDLDRLGREWFMIMAPQDPIDRPHTEMVNTALGLVPQRRVINEQRPDLVLWRWNAEAEVEDARRRTGSFHGQAIDVRPRDELAPNLATLVETRWKIQPPAEGLPIGWRFDPGRTTVSTSLLRMGVDVRGLFNRHAGGDFGVFGRLDAIEPTDEQRWCPGLAPQGAKNAVALERGLGVVRSEYPAVHHEEGRHPDSVKIATIIESLDRPVESFMWCDRDPV